MKKPNWGTSIVIAFFLFMSFILYFIIKVQSNSKYDNELVVEEYYKHDAHYSDELAKIQNAEDLEQKPVIATTDKGVTITFPKEFNTKEIKGKVSLYRPSARILDFECYIRLSNATMLIPKEDFAGGNWDMTLSWSYRGKDYIIKKQLYIQ
ncbi:FixH family protein [Flavobacterium terrisoli]|uniref:FixH family protein n=1 Tax=Flavobacterium terrisoli TaxID=3242195 RepID=UPI002542852E|nr:FixH family protein [Flavobacterium buctense]